MSTTRKTRELRPDLGSSNTSDYSRVSGTIYADTSTPEKQKAFCESIRSQYRYSSLAYTGYESNFNGGETIVSTSGKVKSEVQGMRNCHHTKLRMMQFPVTMCWDYNGTGISWKYFRPYWRFPTSQPFWSNAVDVASKFSATFLSDQFFSARAYWSMRPKLQGEVQALNSIFELKDFAGPLRQICTTDVKGALKKAAVLTALHTDHFSSSNRSSKSLAKSYWNRLVKNAAKSISHPFATVATIGEIASDMAARGILTWNLAVMPTVRDYAKLHAQLQTNVFERANNFIKYGEDGARSHYTENFIHHNSISYGTKGDYIHGDGKYVCTKRTATLVSKYRVLWEKFETRYPYWWGFELGLDEIWNMLPFSWLVDYIATVGKSLELMDRDNSVHILSTDYCESVKSYAQSGHFVLTGPRMRALMVDRKFITQPSYDKPLLVTGTDASVYTRLVKDPYRGPALPELRLPNLKQTANAIALARCLLF